MHVNLALSLVPPRIVDSLLKLSEFTRRVEIDTTTIVKLGGTDSEFRREDLFGAIRTFLEDVSASVSVKDQEGLPWMLYGGPGPIARQVFLKSTGRYIHLPACWAFATNSTTRVFEFDNATKDVNLADRTGNEWRATLAGRAIFDEEYDILCREFELTPTGLTQSILAGVGSGSTEIRTLVPGSMRYFERLVGRAAVGEDLAAYATSIVREHVAQLIHWKPIDGVKLSLLLSSHGLLTQHISLGALDGEQLDSLLTWVEREGDLLSKLGIVEIGLRTPELEPRFAIAIEHLIEEILADDPDQEEGRFAFLSNLITLVIGEMARTRVLLGVPPFWSRLAGIAQASLIERILLGAGVSPSDMTGPLSGIGRGQVFVLKTLLELREEPRWLPEFALPSQLKAEFVGRISLAANENKDYIRSPKLRQMLFGDGPGCLSAHMELPYPHLPGPLEGGVQSILEIPEDYIAELQTSLDAERPKRKSFVALVNSALLFRIGPEQARLAATALRRIRYQLTNADDKSEMLGLISGLAIVASVTRSTELADEIRVLSRVTRRKSGTDFPPKSEVTVALIAAASHEELGGWAKFVGEWLTELSFEIESVDDASAVQLLIDRLIELEPALIPKCGRARAALSTLLR